MDTRDSFWTGRSLVNVEDDNRHEGGTTRVGVCTRRFRTSSDPTLSLEPSLRSLDETLG